MDSGLREEDLAEMGPGPIKLPNGHGSLLEDLKERIQNAQLKAAISVNRELIYSAPYTQR